MKFKIEFGRQGNFILAALLTHFVFFGYICLTLPETVRTRLLFLPQLFFSIDYFWSLIILIAIIFIMGVREKFFEYGIRNSIWLTPVVVLESWFWYWFINDFNLTFIIDYFTMVDGYMTIFTILLINFLTAIVAAYVRQKYDERLKVSSLAENV